MRYKFRAWLKKEKKMVVPYGINFESKVIFYKEPYVDDENMEIIKTASFDEIKLMQCTGWQDKNEIEIYEGDIVNICGFSDRDVVEFPSDWFGFVLTGYDTEGRIISRKALIKYSFSNYPKLEVIGNVWEHKHLLGEQNDN